MVFTTRNGFCFKISKLKEKREEKMKKMGKTLREMKLKWFQTSLNHFAFICVCVYADELMWRNVMGWKTMSMIHITSVSWKYGIWLNSTIVKPCTTTTSHEEFIKYVANFEIELKKISFHAENERYNLIYLTQFHSIYRISISFSFCILQTFSWTTK